VVVKISGDMSRKVLGQQGLAMDISRDAGCRVVLQEIDKGHEADA